MNLSDSRDVLYAPNGMEQECTLCGTTDCPEPQFPPPYKHDFDGSYKPADPLSRIESYIEGTRLSIRDYPYKGGIEDLRTTLICTLNAMSEIVTYLRRCDHDAGSRPSPHSGT